jgi:catechol 2,3-dioxygenase-like lactoylglutathione lyase family enzyme
VALVAPLVAVGLGLSVLAAGPAVSDSTPIRLAPRSNLFLTIDHMALQRMEHVGIVVDDLAAATEFFVDLGLELQGTASLDDRSVDRIVGLEGVRTEVAMMQTPDGDGRLELVKFLSPSHQGDNRDAPANTPGLRHLAFVVQDIHAVVARLRDGGAELVGELENYKDSYWLCYVRGPEGIIIELAERIHS